MDNIIVAGKRIALEAIPAGIKNNLWLGLMAEFDLFVFDWDGQRFLLLVSKGNHSTTPTQCKKMSERIYKNLGINTVYYFVSIPTNVRDRYVDKGVYFVVGNKFAYVPGLIANRRMSEQDFAETLSPAAQYMLLYHLQVKSLDGTSIQELTDILPYKYPTVAKSIKQLVALGLGNISTSDNRIKRMTFNQDKRILWEMALPHLISPIKQVGYIGYEISVGQIGGIEALSHYSMLVGEDTPTRVLTMEESKELELPISQFADVQRIEIWRYTPISNNEYVDKLSLYLTLKDDKDPRVEKELVAMINEMPW